ncbi:uncharacterized protein LOC111910152 [Lactuca sativa]|uniref:Uncharacterized protein n=1 Tax=Lactuca sativa TaxID=4236 RepID=A0A9R1XA78_LACSA|nr:uncharacterized protein LOC111910152 [Lactuca sativa]KAJ0203119.1 hypothetical protein LSAT_V11C500278240 [Lactuca sativa]
MAANIASSSSLFLIHHASAPIKKTSKRVLMLAKSDSSPSSSSSSSSLIRVGSSIKIQKVFEDKSRGIVCYLDDKGEITCEGYDEGPRHQGVPTFSCYQRGEQHIVDLLNRSLLRVVDGGKVN